MQISRLKCDRCDAEGSETDDLAGWSQLRERLQPSRYHKGPWKDLCPHCTSVFAEWFDAVRPKPTGGTDGIPF